MTSSSVRDMSKSREIELLLSTLAYLLNRVAKLSFGKLVPETLDRCQVGSRDALHIREVDKVTALFLGARDCNQGITSKLGNSSIADFGKKPLQRTIAYHGLCFGATYLVGFCQLSCGQHCGKRNVVHAHIARESHRNFFFSHMSICLAMSRRYATLRHRCRLRRCCQYSCDSRSRSRGEGPSRESMTWLCKDRCESRNCYSIQ